MHFQRMRLWNHPPHDLDCCLDRAALLTQEGNTARVLKCLNLTPVPGCNYFIFVSIHWITRSSVA